MRSQNFSPAPNRILENDTDLNRDETLDQPRTTRPRQTLTGLYEIQPPELLDPALGTLIWRLAAATRDPSLIVQPSHHGVRKYRREIQKKRGREWQTNEDEVGGRADRTHRIGEAQAEAELLLSRARVQVVAASTRDGGGERDLL